MGWKQAEEAVEKAKSGKFVKLENDGDWIVVAFPYCGPKPEDEPHVVEELWDDKEEKNVPYTAAHKAAGKDPASKFVFNVYVGKEMPDKAIADPANCELKVYQCTVATCKEIFAARDKYGMDNFFEIKRFGAARSKKTKYKVMYDDKLSDAHKARIAELAKDKHDLANLNEDDDTKQGSKPKANGAAAASGSSSTISDTIADELLPKLKEMPDDKRKGFLKEFGISRVRELKMSDVDRARAWISGKPAAKEDDAFT